MGFEVGRTVGQVDQWWDENIKITSDKGKYQTIEDAQRAAKESAAADDEDAVIVKEGNEYHVFGTDEIGKLDPSGNEATQSGQFQRYQIHDMDPTANIVSFVVTARNQEGNASGSTVSLTPTSDEGLNANVKYFRDQLQNSSVASDRPNLLEKLLYGEGLTRQEVQELHDLLSNSRCEGGGLEGIRMQNDATLMEIFGQALGNSSVWNQDEQEEGEKKLTLAEIAQKFVHIGTR